jgi:hypothetical protein
MALSGERLTVVYKYSRLRYYVLFYYLATCYRAINIFVVYYFSQLHLIYKNKLKRKTLVTMEREDVEYLVPDAAFAY